MNHELWNLIFFIKKYYKRQHVFFMMPINKYLMKYIILFYKLGYIDGYELLMNHYIKIYLKYDDLTPAIRTLTPLSKTQTPFFSKYRDLFFNNKSHLYHIFSKSSLLPRRHTHLKNFILGHKHCILNNFTYFKFLKFIFHRKNRTIPSPHDHTHHSLKKFFLSRYKLRKNFISPLNFRYIHKSLSHTFKKIEQKKSLVNHSMKMNILKNLYKNKRMKKQMKMRMRMNFWMKKIMKRKMIAQVKTQIKSRQMSKQYDLSYHLHDSSLDQSKTLILSTNKGIITHHMAHKLRVGGQLICNIY